MEVTHIHSHSFGEKQSCDLHPPHPQMQGTKKCGPEEEEGKNAVSVSGFCICSFQMDALLSSRVFNSNETSQDGCKRGLRGAVQMSYTHVALSQG